ncbi:MAG TPA: DUF4124 domain-containing protein [Gammaproteobacteria bacterium]|nr:DUF4124 domain-containing protein [Gammaproteobacteria bacterium]
MKLKIFTMLVILGLLAVTPMIYMGRFDPMAVFDGGVSRLEKLKAKAPKNLTSVVTDKKVQVYQWRDQNGILQYSNTPPVGITAKQVTLSPDKNVIQSTRVTPAKVDVRNGASSTDITRPYSVSGMKQVMEDARNVEQVLKKSHEDRQKMLRRY